MKKVECQVRKVTRYIVTKYAEEHLDNGGSVAGCATMGEYDNPDVAYDVAYALCRAEHEKSGEPIDSPNFIYPKMTEDAEAA